MISKEAKNAAVVFKAICDAIEERNWKYETNLDTLSAYVFLNTEDLPLNLSFSVNMKQEIVEVLSLLPFEFRPEKRVEGAIACSFVTLMLRQGAFVTDYDSGSTWFRLAASYRDMVVTKDFIGWLLTIAAVCVDHYNDKLYMVDRGELSVSDFMKLF